MIYSFRDISPGQIVGPVDVCIIGSGAGSAVMAHYLAKAGLKVVIVEKGGYFPAEDLGRKEVHMLTRIQAITIFTPATGRHTRVSLIAGECYGGGTVASESVTWDFAQVVLGNWEKLGLRSYFPANPKMEEYRRELREPLNVQSVPMNHHNPCNQILMIGAEREGIRWKGVERPVIECRCCGNCTQGCRYQAKQDMANTFLLWAQNHGADAYCGAQAESLRVNFPGPDDQPFREKLARSAAREDVLRELERRKRSAPAKFTLTATVTDRREPLSRNGEGDSKTLVVHDHEVVLAAGPVGTSRLLIRSRINPNGVAGKRFTTHPTAMQIGRFGPDVSLNGWDGINDTIEVHHFSDMMRGQPYCDPERHGFLLEGALSLAWGLANLLPGTGGAHVGLMRDMNRMAGIEVNIKSAQYGRIMEDDIQFDISERDNGPILFGTWMAARLLFRAGARQVFTGLPGLVLDSPSQLYEVLDYRLGTAWGYMQRQANLCSGHIFCGAIMGTDPKDSSADETGECHEIRGLWVADGAAFPTNVGSTAHSPSPSLPGRLRTPFSLIIVGADFQAASTELDRIWIPKGRSLKLTRWNLDPLRPEPNIRELKPEGVTADRPTRNIILRQPCLWFYNLPTERESGRGFHPPAEIY
jgi:long-chain-alcohol oxidase